MECANVLVFQLAAEILGLIGGYLKYAPSFLA